MKKQANSTFCFVCGVKNFNGLQMKFYDVSPGEVTAQITVPEHFQGYPGVVHGGIVAAMLDEVSGRTILGGDTPRWMFTAKLNLRYRKPVPIGEKLTLRGRCLEIKGSVARVSGEIFDESNQLLAEAEAFMMDIPQGMQQSMNFGPEDWQVYPEEEQI